MPEETSTPEEPTSRDAGDEEAGIRPRSPVGNRWAVIAGISQYADRRLTLRYAHQDAKDLYDFLLTPAGGAFAPERIRLLLDEGATTQNLTRAVLSFLSATKQDDLVIIYFACHGQADASAAGQPLYVLTHDTDLDDLPGTAWPMDNLAWGIRNYVQAKRIVILADTCHSEGMATGGRGSDLGAAVLNTYLEGLSASKAGIAYLTSAREDQRSYEDVKWGGGHGAFTWFLLQGMRGDADGYGGRPRDGVVSLGELAAYVGDHVFAETRRRQQPVLGAGRYDLELPLAVAGGLDAEAREQLARALLEVGWLQDDPAPFLCAAHEATAAIELASLTGAALPRQHALAGEALLASGEAERASDLLGTGVARFGDDMPPESWLHLGLARVAVKEYEAASKALAEYAKRAPRASESGWARDFAAWLRRKGGTTRALLVGIGSYALANVPPLAGPPNDVDRMADLFTSRLGVTGQHLTVLQDSRATRDGVIAALTSLARSSTDRDNVVFYFSGHGLRESDPAQPFLITYDAPGDQVSGLTAVELVALIGAIPARARVMILDTHGNPVFDQEMARAPHITALVASVSGSMAYEELSGTRPFGAFTATLASAWEEADDPAALTYGQLVNAAATPLREKFGQVPALLGDPSRTVLEGEFGAADEWRLSRVRAATPVPAAAAAASRAGGWLRGRRVVGRAALNEAGGPRGVSAEALEEGFEAMRAFAEDEGDPWSWLDAARIALAMQRSDEALDALARFGAAPSETRWNADPARATTVLEALRDARPRALLVGIGTHADPSLPAVKGAAADVGAMRAFLVQRGFAESDLTVVQDEAATRTRILDELTSLRRHSVDQLAVLYIAANGSLIPTGDPTIVPYDGRGGGADDLTLSELGGSPAEAPNLVSIVDAGCGYGRAEARFRSVEAGAGTPAPRQYAGLVPLSIRPEIPPIGVVTLLAEVPGPGDAPASAPRERARARRGTARGVLTDALIATMSGSEPLTATYATWAETASARAKFTIMAVGPSAGERPLLHRTRHQAVLDELTRLATAPAATAAELAERLIAKLEGRSDRSPATYLELGLALEAKGDAAESIRFLRTARNLYEDPTIRTEQEERDPNTDVWYREACYHLGRQLLEHEQGVEALTDAVATLRHAHYRAPDDPRLCLHLGLAIRALVEEETLVEAHGLLQAYLSAGAPLGRVDEVRAVLEERLQTR